MITWKNISAPNFAGANALLSDSSNKITQGLSNLGSTFTAIDEENKLTNSQSFLDSVNSSSSLEELNKLAGSKDFTPSALKNKNVNSGEILEALNKRKAELTSENYTKEDRQLTKEQSIADALFRKNQQDISLANLDIAKSNSQIRASEARTQATIANNTLNQYQIDQADKNYLNDFRRQWENATDAGSRAKLLSQARNSKNLSDVSKLSPFEEQFAASAQNSYDSELLRDPTNPLNTIPRKVLHESQLNIINNEITKIPQRKVLSSFEGDTAEKVTSEFIKANSDDIESWGIFGSDKEEIKTKVNEAVKNYAEKTNKILDPRVVATALESVPSFLNSGSEDALEKALINTQKLFDIEEGNESRKLGLQENLLKLQFQYEQGRQNAPRALLKQK